MERFNSNEELEATPLSIAKDIIYSDGSLADKVKQIEKALIEAQQVNGADTNDETALPKHDKVI